LLRSNYPHQGSEGNLLRSLDARIKLIFLLTMLIGLALIQSPSFLQAFSYLLFILLIASIARLPVIQIAFTSMLAFPFVGFFSLAIYLTGDASRAWAILTKSYLSALTVLVCVTATPLPDLISAAMFFKFPQFLLGITQIIYRYLFVLAAQVRTMQIAFQARGGRKRRLAILASSGMIAVLFSRSYQKAIVVNHAMLSRGYSGNLPCKSFAPFRYRELGALVLGLGFVIGLQFI
jgi:cobalt/nickel transport system permease protein